MTQTVVSTPASSVREQKSAKDDWITLSAISVVASMVATMLHEGIGHAALALATGQTSGTLTTVAWSSNFDSRLVAAGGTLVNLAAAFGFWIGLRTARNTRASFRFFLLIAMAFNLFAGTGYFFFSGVTDFGDWAAVIHGQQPYWLWRTGLILIGIATYWGAIRLVGASVVWYMGVSPADAPRFRRLMFVPYVAALLIEAIAGLLNPFGIRFVFESALAATAGANCGMLWLQYYVPRRTLPGPHAEAVRRNYAWIAIAVALAAGFIGILGPGITIHR